MTQHQAPAGATLARGTEGSLQDSTGARAALVPPAPSVITGSVAASPSGAVATGCGTRLDPWPDWARSQLEEAVAIARAAPPGTNVATLLHREWFTPRVDGPSVLRAPGRLRPLAGVYRAAHAGAGVRRTSDGLSVLARHDVVATDGWWRTWGESWAPPRARANAVRIVLTPHPGRLAAFVRTVTATMLDSPAVWALACATNAARMRHAGGAVLQLVSIDELPPELLDDLAGVLHPAATPLAAPLAPGAGLVVAPTNGMTFGEHRCHLVALALRQPASAEDPLGAIASVFAAHGVRPATPWRSR